MERRDDKTGYVLAIVAAAAFILFRVEVDRLTGTHTSFPLFGLAVVFLCIWKAGRGPALLATAITTGWYISEDGIADAGAWLHYALYIAESSALLIYGHQLRVARDLAARGEEWQRHLVETAGEGIWTVDPSGVIDNANPRIAEILGCRVDQIVGRKAESFLFPEDVPAERIRFQNRRPGVKEQYDRRLRCADGAEVWTLASSSPWSYQGRDAGVLTMMTDITERKQAERALRRSESKFRELFENVCVGVYQTSLDGRILEANPELLRMLSFSSRDELNVPGVVKGTFVDPELHLTLRDRLERDGSYANVEFQLRTRDGRIVTVSENARVVRDETGEILYFEGTLTDVTGKLLVEKQLRDAQRMEALGRLAGGIARDFRAIGNNMSSNLQDGLDALPHDSPARLPIESVARALGSAQALTRQILDFSQRQTQGVTDINTLLLNLEESLRRAAGTDLELFLCAEPAPVLANPAHMDQILTSLMLHVRDCGLRSRPIALSTAIGPTGSSPVPSVCLSIRAAIDSVDSGAPRPWIGISTSQAILSQYGGAVTAVADPEAIRYAIRLPLCEGLK